jgi:O-antigen/teichoic acid export membrane protein
MGPAYASSATYLAVLTIPQFTSVAQYASAFVLAGIAKHRPLAFLMLAEAIVNLVLSVVLVQKMGLLGVALGTVIPHLICTAVAIPAYTIRVLGMRWSDYLAAYVRPVLCGLPVAALGYMFSTRAVTSWLAFAAEAAAMCGTFAVMSYFVCLTRTQRTTVSGKLSLLFFKGAAAHGA